MSFKKKMRNSQWEFSPKMGHLESPVNKEKNDVPNVRIAFRIPPLPNHPSTAQKKMLLGRNMRAALHGCPTDVIDNRHVSPDDVPQRFQTMTLDHVEAVPENMVKKEKLEIIRLEREKHNEEYEVQKGVQHLVNESLMKQVQEEMIQTAKKHLFLQKQAALRKCTASDDGMIRREIERLGPVVTRDQHM